MNKKVKNIEQLYSESFNDFRMEPSSGLWKRISSRLAWKNFISFNPTTFNAYYLTGILTVSIAGALWITNPVTENNQEIKEITINNTIANPVITSVQEVSRKSKVKTEEQRSNKDMKPVPKPASSSEVLTKEDSSSVVLTKEDSSTIVTTKADLSAVVTTKAENQKPDSGINDPVNLKLQTSNLKPQTSNFKLSPSALFKLYPESPDLPNDPINFVNLSKNAVRCEWSFGDSQTSDEFEPTHFYNRADNYNIKLKVWSEDGCVDSLVISYDFANSAYLIEFPNAFTPNINGPTNGYYTPGIPNNNVFHPVYKGVVEYHLRIFNRRGELIFESNDINVGWDGYINARLAAQDVYVWKVRGRYSNGQSFTKFGNVMLIKK